MKSNSPRLDDFLAFSVVMTGFSNFNLEGTGQASSYFSTTVDVVGEDLVGELLDLYRQVEQDASDDEVTLENGLRNRILSHPKLGPVGRNIIKLWYVGVWYQLPSEWRQAYGAREKDSTFVVSAQAYPEGLLWPAIGANPSGAKGPGYGTWGEKPVFGQL